MEFSLLLPVTRISSQWTILWNSLEKTGGTAHKKELNYIFKKVKKAIMGLFINERSHLDLRLSPPPPMHFLPC